MSTLLRTVEFLCLSLWLGSDVFLSFVVAPGVFQILVSRDQACAIVGYSLSRMHFLGIACAIIFLIARLFRTRTVSALIAPAAVCVIFMLVLTVISHYAVSPKIAVLRTQMGSTQATEPGSPLLTEFSRWHRLSVSLESGVLLAGIAATYFLARDLGQSH